MLKKLTFLTITLTMILSTVLMASPIIAEENSQVCGVDNETYDSAEAAEAAGVDVSYEFACVDPTSEEGLYEAESDMNFAGMLIEIGSTDLPTTIIVRGNSDSADYTIEVTSDTALQQRTGQETELSNWIPGDQIKVAGNQNENTDTIEAIMLSNVSILDGNRGVNGWITDINIADEGQIIYQWMNVEHTFNYSDDTRIVSGLKNPASVDDLVVGDRIRVRLDLEGNAEIIVVLRRGEDLFMKIRTFRPNATLVRLDSTIVPTTIQIKMEKTPGLRANDVNNLIGTEGTLVTVNITEDTKIVRKYFGETTLEEFSVGDKLHLIGRANDDGTVDVKVVKNNSIWKTSTQGHAGVVAAVDANNSYIMVNWTPIKYLTRKQLKESLSQADNTVVAQALNRSSLRERLKQRIKTIVAQKIGKFVRNVKHKKVVINRIKHSNINIGNLIKRKAVRKIRVDITDDTEIVIGTNRNAAISDIQIGDKVRIRGTKHANLLIVTAETIVVVNSLPEIEESLDTSLDDVNEIVSEIVTDDTDNALTENTTTDTEEEVVEDSSATACKGEGESIPVIADPPVCCDGLTLISPKEAGIIGVSGICTALCGNGVCDTDSESFYNCPDDCAEE